MGGWHRMGGCGGRRLRGTMFMKCLFRAAVLATALAPVLAWADDILTDQDYAYVAAQNVQLEQSTLDAICKRTPSAKTVRHRFEDFVVANPEYAAALSSTPSSPAAASRAKDLTAQYRDGLKLIMNMAAQMPPEMVCASFFSKPRAPFAQNIESARKLAAVPKAPAPIHPDDAQPEVRLARGDLERIVQLVLEHKDMAMYLHPELAERVPVRVAFESAYAGSSIGVAMYGKPVRVVTGGDAVRMTIRGTANTAKVGVEYRPEGVHGTFRLVREGDVWKVTEAQVFE